MKRLTLLLLGLALGVSATAGAQGLTMQMSNGWAFTFGGNVNVFWVFSSDSTKASKTSNIRTGLLPAFATFDAKGKEGGLNLGVHIGFAPQIQNPGSAHDAQGAQIDMRQVYLTVGFKDGSQILAGRELGLFLRQNILQDMTLFGVGAVGAPQGGGTTLGRIGYGYVYPNFNAQVTYSSPAKNQVQLSVGLFQPGVLLPSYSVTKIPRLEAEATWRQTQGKNKYTVWVGGQWQSVSTVVGDSSKSIVGGTAGVKVNVEDLAVVVSGYVGSGIGTWFSGLPGAPSDGVAGNAQLRKSDGGYAQLTYTFNKKTTVGASWGTSRLKGSNAAGGDGTDGPVGVTSMYTVGVYHQWTKSLKVVFEGSREINSHTGTQPGSLNDLVGVPRLNRTVLDAGFMLFY